MAKEKAEKGATEEGQVPKKKKGKFGLILIAGIGLVVVLGGAAAWFLLFSPSSTMSTPSSGSGETSSGTAPRQETVRYNPEMGPLFPLDTFVVNLQEKEGERYLKVSVKLEMDNDVLSRELTNRTPQLRDTIISLLSSKSYEEISSLSGKQVLKSEIKARINRLLNTGKIQRVYFTEFVVQ